MDGVFIVGSGALGSSLAMALAQKGVPITGVHDQSSGRVFAVSGAVGAKGFLTDELPSLVHEASTVILAVPETAIREIATQAAQRAPLCDDQVWLHTSGAVGLDALEPLRERGVGLGIVHPVWVFPPGQTVEIPEGTYFGCTGDEAAISRSRQIVATLEGRWLAAPSERRAAYHAAMVMASNYQAAVLSVARGLLAGIGIESEEAEDVVLSLGAASIDSLQRSGLAAGLSGPIRRGDGETVSRHLAALAHLPRAHEAYRVLGECLVDLVREEELLEQEQTDAVTRALCESISASQSDDD